MLVNGNALHIPLADKSVQCCVTSPPYWGLRDYGTAIWVDGDDPECEHLQSREKGIESSTLGGGQKTNSHNQEPYTSYCRKCGAIRIDNQLGLEQTPEEYVENMVQVFREVWRVLRDDGTLWLNLGDSYAGNMSRASSGGRAGYGTKREGIFQRGGEGLKDKDLVGIPWRVAFALQADGWYLRNDIIWHKPNPMPESVRDRCTKSHEYIFLMTKNARYYYDSESVKEPYAESSFDRYKYAVADHSVSEEKRKDGWVTTKNRDERKMVEMNPAGRNKRTVWTITTKPYKGAHYATFPPELPEVCIKAGSAEGDMVLDPFAGSGTTCMVARDLGRNAVGLDLSLDYLINNARKRLEIDKLEYWKTGGEEVESNFEGLPMFGQAGKEKDHKNMHRDKPNSFHVARLKGVNDGRNDK